MKNVLNTNTFDKNKPTVMYIHGWTEDTENDASQKIVEAFRIRGDHNILLCDWGEYAKSFYFSSSIPQLYKISLKVAKRLKELIDGGYNSKKLYLVGYSLGVI